MVVVVAIAKDIRFANIEHSSIYYILDGFGSGDFRKPWKSELGKFRNQNLTKNNKVMRGRRSMLKIQRAR